MFFNSITPFYNQAHANQKDKVIQHKKINLKLAVAGITAIIAAAGFFYLRATVDFSVQNEGNLLIPNKVTCPADNLKEILKAGGSDSITAKTFRVLEDTQGISCDNYLPWQNEFNKEGINRIDGINTTHLQKPVMWGIDNWKRPYIAIKYVCNQNNETLLTLFQSAIHSGSLLSIEESFRPVGCYLDFLRPVLKMEFLNNLTSLFKEETIVSPKWDNSSFCILNLAK